MKAGKFGFTLVELIIVTAMLSCISLAIYATFNNGLKIWQRVNQQLPEEDLYIFFDKFSGDLSNSFQFKGLPLLGEEERLEFATLVNSPRLNKKTVGKVIYFYDRQTETLNKEQLDFAQIYSGKEGPIQQLVKNVRALKFQYYLYDAGKQEYRWEEEWVKEELPSAVRIELELNHGGKFNKFTKTVSIPVSG